MCLSVGGGMVSQSSDGEIEKSEMTEISWYADNYP